MPCLQRKGKATNGRLETRFLPSSILSMYSNFSDIRLCHLFALGDFSALNELIERHRDRVYLILATELQDDALAEDALPLVESYLCRYLITNVRYPVLIRRVYRSAVALITTYYRSEGILPDADDVPVRFNTHKTANSKANSIIKIHINA